MTALVRFIPAYAGNAVFTLTQMKKGPAHPRIRGERIRMASFLIMPSGSSPHTRGTLGGKLDALRHVRFIPAYAGNACGGARTPSALAVHPRIRGERNDPENSLKIKDGSSPHTRGTLSSKTETMPKGRFIPAYAGNAGLHR